MTIRAVVFDLDGLMFDTEALFFRVSSDVLESRGKRFTPEIMRQLIGRRSIEVAGWLKTLAGLEEPPEVILAEVKERFAAEVDSAVHPTPGLFAILDHLGRRSLPAAVATSSGRAYADRLLTRPRARRPIFVRTGLGGRDPRQARPGNLPGGRRTVRRRGRKPAGAGGQPGRTGVRAGPAPSPSASRTNIARPRHSRAPT